jgi:hypothetical protein
VAKDEPEVEMLILVRGGRIREPPNTEKGDVYVAGERVVTGNAEYCGGYVVVGVVVVVV